MMMLFFFIHYYSIVGCPLYYVGICLFEKHNLMTILNLDNTKVMKFLGEFLTSYCTTDHLLLVCVLL